MKKYKISNYIITIIFIGLLISVMIITVIKPKKVYSYYENRGMTPIPEFSKETLIDGTYFNDMESYLIDHCAFRESMVKLDIWLDLKLKRPMINDVVIQDDILLQWNNFENVNKAEIDKQAEFMADNLLKINNTINSYGGYFCYAAVPCQYAYFESEYPSYLNSREEYTKESLSSLRNYMNKNNLNFIDMGEVFDKLGNKEDYYSKVDNHYTLYGAYETYKSIIGKINSDTNFNLEFPDGDNIIFEEEPTYYLGSRLRKIMNLWPGEERLVKAKFKKDIPFTRMDNSVTTEATMYPEGPNEYNHVLYSYYMGGDIPETFINTKREDLPSVLIYGDSFTNAVECLMYYSFDEMRSVDLRYYNEMSLEEYINLYKPDVVICIRDYEALLSSDGNGKFFK